MKTIDEINEDILKLRDNNQSVKEKKPLVNMDLKITLVVLLIVLICLIIYVISTL